MSYEKVHLSKDLLEPLEQVRIERHDRTIGTTTRALLREILISRGLLDLEQAPQEEEA